MGRRMHAVVIPRMGLKRDVAHMLFASIIEQVSLDGNLLVRLENDVSSELPNCLDTSAGATDKLGKPRSVVSDTFENPLRQRWLTPGVW